MLACGKASTRTTQILAWHTHVTEHVQAYLLPYGEPLEDLPHLVPSALNPRPGVGWGGMPMRVVFP